MTTADFPNPKIIGTKAADVSYISRSAVRAVVFNAAGEVAIIFAERDNYFKLPGGGIDPGECDLKAVQREMEEETGCLIKIRDGCIATTEEFRNDLHQISYCYCADLVDDSRKPTLTEDEISDKLSHSWMPVEEAKRAMSAAEPTSELGQFIKERDMYLLDVATREASAGADRTYV
jgi:8-oxo-dGTP diphosphatase